MLKQFVRLFAVFGVLIIVACGFLTYNLIYDAQKSQKLAETKLGNVQKELSVLKNEDQYKRNEALQANIKNIENTYKNAVVSFEKIQDLRAQKQDVSDLDKLYAQILNDLSKQNYTSASSELTDLNSQIDKKNQTLAQTAVQNAASSSNTPLATSNTPPSSGFSSQQVKTDKGSFAVNLVAADLNTTRVIVDTASESDCSNNCPVLPLSDYVSRNNAFAGINGTFFCPAEYPSCAGKTNSFDTLLMNKNKHYFNSDNNKYSTVPLVYFTGNSMGARSQTLQWGRDTSVDSVIAMQPMYVMGGSNMFGGSSDPKITSKGARCFIANKGSTVYIGVIYNASAEDAASVLTTLGMENALGLDQGGSTALWYGGYKAGPGRSIPNAILFVRK